MDSLVSLQVNNKNLREAISIVKDSFCDDPNHSLDSLCSLLFEGNFPYPSNYIQGFKNIIKQNKKDEEFYRKAHELVSKSFWKSEDPNLCSFYNFWACFGQKKLFNDNKADFLVLLERSIVISDPLLYKYLPKMLEECLNGKDSYQIVFQSILSVIERPMCYESFINMSRVLANCIIKLNLDLPQLEEAKLLYIESEIYRINNNQQNSEELISRIKGKLSNSDEDSVVYYLNAYFNCCLVAKDLHSMAFDVSSFLISYFQTSIEYLKLTLANLFNRILKIAKKEGKDNEIAQVIIRSLDDFPLQSKIKKWVLPNLILYYDQDQLDDFFYILLDLLSDSINHPFASKCAMSIAKFEAPSLAFIKFIINYIQKFQVYDNLLKLSCIFSPIFKSQAKLAQVAYDLSQSVENEFHRMWLTLEILSSSPKTLISEIDVRKILNEMKFDGNWHLRVLYFSLFVTYKFPKKEEDEKYFLDLYDSLFMIDSPNYKSIVLTLFEEMVSNFPKPSTFLSIILNRSIRMISPTYFSLQRQFAYMHSVAILKKFPSLLEDIHKKYFSTLINENFIIDRTFLNKLFKPELIYPQTIDQESLTLFKRQLTQTKAPPEFCIRVFEDMISKGFSWEIQVQFFEILAILISNNTDEELVRSVADYIFNALMETRIAGFISMAVSSFEKILKFVKKPLPYTDDLVAALSNFDMAGMRRSAALPYIALALIKNEHSTILTETLLDMITNSNNDTEVANALNVMKALINELDDSVLEKVLEVVFIASVRFKSWDVISAVNITFVAIIRKLKLSSMISSQLFSRFKNSENILTNALESESYHAKYLALILLEQLKGKCESEKMLNLINQNVPSKIVRIRRAAARAFASLSPNPNVELADVSCFNQLHGKLLVMKEIKQKISEQNIENWPRVCQDCYYDLRNEIKTIEFDPNLSIDDLLKCDKKLAIPFLVKKLISEDINTMSQTYVMKGFDYLLANLTPDKISSNNIPIIKNLLNNRQTSYKVKSCLISMLRFVDEIDFEDFSQMFLEYALDTRDELAAVHIALAKLSRIFIKVQSCFPVLMVLVLNDIPAVRTNVMRGFLPEFPSELKAFQYLKTKIPAQLLMVIRNNMVNKIKNKIENDKWGEPISTLVDDFFLPLQCNPESMKLLDSDYVPQTLNEARIDFISRKVDITE